MSRKAIYVCYPFSDDPVFRTIKVRHLAKEIDKQGYLPLAVHLYWPQILQTGVPNMETPGPVRDRVLEHCTQMVRWCDELWAFGDKMGEDGMPELISDGMAAEIEEARTAGIPVVGKDMQEFVPGTILGEGRDKFLNQGMDLTMSSIRNSSGGWGVKVISSSPDLGQNLFTLGQGLVILLQSSVAPEQLPMALENFFVQVQHLAQGGVKSGKEEMM